MSNGSTARRWALRASVAILVLIAAPALLQSQPAARAAGPARAPAPAASSHSDDAHGLVPSWFKADVIEGSLLDRLKQRRLARGDARGAARVDVLRKWFGLFGLYRGLPALGMDLFRHRGLATEIVQDWTQLMERFAAEPTNGGPTSLSRGRGREVPELLATHRTAVLEWVRLAMRKARKAFKGGAVSRLLYDIYTEVTSDPLFVSDVLEEAQQLGWKAQATVTISDTDGDGGKLMLEQLKTLAQEVFEVAREELFPDEEKKRGGFFRFLGGGSHQRKAPSPAPAAAPAKGKDLGDGDRGSEL